MEMIEFGSRWQPKGQQLPLWNVHRDGHWGYPSDEWVGGSSWNGSRVLMKSTERYMDLKLCISIQGTRRSSGKLRPRCWAASVSVDSTHEQVSRYNDRGSSCKSVRDATRQADAHPGIEAAITRLLGRLYSRLGAGCVYRWSEEDGAWKPLCTAFYRARDVWPGMAKGKYCTVQWQRPGYALRKKVDNPDEPRIVRGVIEVHNSGWAGCMGVKNDETIKNLTPWLDNLDPTC